VIAGSSERWSTAPSQRQRGAFSSLRAASPKGTSSVTDRIRFALLFLVVLSTIAARAGGALGATGTIHKAQHAARISHATAVAKKQAKVVRYARRYLGVRYVYGGTSPSYGFDCSGFTRFVYSHFGIALPHYSGSQFYRGRSVSRAGLRPGDLVFFDGLGHVGLYIGSGLFIHAPHSGTSVSIDSLNGWYAARYDGARRLL
jgi:cell wall-associated NlpC family hydrolase